MKFNKILLFSIIILVILGFSIYLFFNDSETIQQEVNCSDEIDMNHYNVFGADMGFVSCYGILVQEKNYDDDKFYIYDHRHDYSIAALKNKDVFKIVDNTIYLVQLQEESERIRYSEEYKDYYSTYVINGEFQPFDYSSLSEIPKYLSIDINTGDVTIYPNNLDEIPEAERNIFQELEQE